MNNFKDKSDEVTKITMTIIVSLSDQSTCQTCVKQLVIGDIKLRDRLRKVAA